MLFLCVLRVAILHFKFKIQLKCSSNILTYNWNRMYSVFWSKEVCNVSAHSGIVHFVSVLRCNNIASFWDSTVGQNDGLSVYSFGWEKKTDRLCYRLAQVKELSAAENVVLAKFCRNSTSVRDITLGRYCGSVATGFPRRIRLELSMGKVLNETVK